MFTDPLGQFIFELPLGWGYNLARSNLITTVFTRADRQSESVSIRALPSFAPEAGNQEWQNIAQTKAFSQNMYPARSLRCGNKKALFSHANDTDSSNLQVLLLQGKRMDILVQHFDPEYPAEDGPTEVMSSVCRSLLVPSDYVQPEFSEQHQVNTALQAAQQAVMQEDWEQVSRAAPQVLAQARDTYLFSVAKRAFMPEVKAVLAVIDALVFLGQAKASMYHLRDAELIVHRAQHTLVELPDLDTDRKDELLTALDGRRQTIGKLQQEIMQLLDGFEKEEKAPLVMQRAKFLLHNACIAGERLDYDSALSSANCAVEDMLMLRVSVLQAPEHLDQDASLKVRETLSIVEGESGEKQIQPTKRHLNRFLLGEMVDALRVLGTVRAARGEDTGALRTSQLLASISRTLDRPEPTPTGYILPFSDHRRHLAATTLELIEN